MCFVILTSHGHCSLCQFFQHHEYIFMVADSFIKFHSTNNRMQITFIWNAFVNMWQVTWKDHDTILRIQRQDQKRQKCQIINLNFLVGTSVLQSLSTAPRICWAWQVFPYNSWAHRAMLFVHYDSDFLLACLFLFLLQKIMTVVCLADYQVNLTQMAWEV